MKKTIKIIFYLMLLFLLFTLTSCKDNNKTVEVESIEVKSNGSRITINHQMQFNYTIYPDNATNKTVTWYLNDNTLGEIDDSGLFTAYDKEGLVKVYCVSKNGIVDAKAVIIDLYSGDYFDQEHIVDLDNINPIINEDLFEFANKYNDCILYGKNMIDNIKSNCADNELITLINKLEESYFSESRINEEALIILKKPNVHNLSFIINTLSVGESSFDVIYKVNNNSLVYNTYYKDYDYIIYQVKISENDEFNNIIKNKLEPLQLGIMKINYDEILINNEGELK